jgi:hypothetical protein
MDKKDYIEKIRNILQLKQFKHTTKSLLNEKEEEMNRYLRQLQKDNVINKELFYKIRSTCSSLSLYVWTTKNTQAGLSSATYHLFNW